MPEVRFKTLWSSFTNSVLTHHLQCPSLLLFDWIWIIKWGAKDVGQGQMVNVVLTSLILYFTVADKEATLFA